MLGDEGSVCANVRETFVYAFYAFIEISTDLDKISHDFKVKNCIQIVKMMLDRSYPKKKSFFYGWLICERISEIKIFFGERMDEEELILIRVGIKIEMRYQRISEFRWKFHAQCYCNWYSDSRRRKLFFCQPPFLSLV